MVILMRSGLLLTSVDTPRDLAQETLYSSNGISRPHEYSYPLSNNPVWNRERLRRLYEPFYPAGYSCRPSIPTWETSLKFSINTKYHIFKAMVLACFPLGYKFWVIKMTLTHLWWVPWVNNNSISLSSTTLCMRSSITINL